jgi:hypothetical protein
MRQVGLPPYHPGFEGHPPCQRRGNPYGCWRRAELTLVDPARCFVDCWSANEKCSNDGHYCGVNGGAARGREASGKMAAAGRCQRQRLEELARERDKCARMSRARCDSRRCPAAITRGGFEPSGLENGDEMSAATASGSSHQLTIGEQLGQRRRQTGSDRYKHSNVSSMARSCSTKSVRWLWSYMLSR